jgi:hypothetical protein
MAECDGCSHHGNLGFRIATRDEGLMAIERCDTCERFDCDAAARNFVVAARLLPAHIFVEPEPPCYLCVTLKRRDYRLASGLGTP